MLALLGLFLPFFLLVCLGWGAARGRLLLLDGIPALNSFVLFFGLSAMLFRLGASGALVQPDLLGLVLAYGLGGTVVVATALAWAVRQGLGRRDGGLLALATAFPNTGFLGLPLLTGLLGAQAAGPVAATILFDVPVLSSLCLAWAHSHGARAQGALAAGRSGDAWGGDGDALQAARQALKGALRNPLLWSMGLGVAWAETGWALPHPVDETLRLLGLSATPAALFTLGAMLARAQMRQAHGDMAGAGGMAGVHNGPPRPVTVLVLLKLGVHPALVAMGGWGLQHAGVPLSAEGLLTVTLAAALPAASNVSMLAEREGADTALVARVILWTTAAALLSLLAWSHVLGVHAASGVT
jgi:predicted permease